MQAFKEKYASLELNKPVSKETSFEIYSKRGEDGYWIGKKLSQSLYRVRIGYTDDAGLAAIPEDATVVFVMNHRSNMDYIIASYLAAERAAENNAASPGPRPSWSRNHELACTCRAPASSEAGTSAAVSDATAPRAVRMARSPPRDSATVIPVGVSSRTTTKRTSTPSAAS